MLSLTLPNGEIIEVAVPKYWQGQNQQLSLALNKTQGLDLLIDGRMTTSLIYYKREYAVQCCGIDQWTSLMVNECVSEKAFDTWCKWNVNRRCKPVLIGIPVYLSSNNKPQPYYAGYGHFVRNGTLLKTWHNPLYNDHLVELYIIWPTDPEVLELLNTLTVVNNRTELAWKAYREDGDR